MAEEVVDMGGGGGGGRADQGWINELMDYIHCLWFGKVTAS